MNLREIDVAIRGIVRDLNAAGFATYSSCQGKTCLDDFVHNRHCDHSFISFDDHDALKGKKLKAKRLGLHIYNGGESITALSGYERSADTIMARNQAFTSKMRELFDL